MFNARILTTRQRRLNGDNWILDNFHLMISYCCRETSDTVVWKLETIMNVIEHVNDEVSMNGNHANVRKENI